MVNQQLIDTSRERDESLRKGEELNGLVATLQSRVDGLEAQAEQLEQDRYTTQGAMEALQAQHQEVRELLTRTQLGMVMVSTYSYVYTLLLVYSFFFY